MKVHHIGYAVRNIEDAFKKFQNLGYIRETEIISDEIRNVFIQFIIKDGYRVELVAPLKENSPVDKILKKGNTPYHICYETNDICKTIEELSGSGYTSLGVPEKAPAIHNRRVVFLFSKDMGLIELVEKLIK